MSRWRAAGTGTPAEGLLAELLAELPTANVLDVGRVVVVECRLPESTYMGTRESNAAGVLFHKFLVVVNRSDRGAPKLAPPLVAALVRGARSW